MFRRFTPCILAHLYTRRVKRAIPHTRCCVGDFLSANRLARVATENAHRVLAARHRAAGHERALDVDVLAQPHRPAIIDLWLRGRSDGGIVLESWTERSSWLMT